MIAVTGATGHLGRLVVEQLLEVVPAAQIVALVRSPEKAADLAARGVQVRIGDYAQPSTLPAALAGARRLLLVSSNDLASRIDQHKAVIDAAKAAGVEFAAYTSVLHANASRLGLAASHLATEQYLQASGLGYILLRNGWYLENETAAFGPALAHGATLGASGQGRISGAARADYAAAAVKALTGTATNAIYELAGDSSYTKADIAAELSRLSGKTVVYNNLAPADYAKALESFGLPTPIAELLADSDRWTAEGDLEDNAKQLSTLIGRPTTTLAQAVAAALKQR